MIFFVSQSQINWALSGMARHKQINSKVYMRNIFKRQIWSSFLCILNPHKRKSYGNHCRLLVSDKTVISTFFIGVADLFLRKFCRFIFVKRVWKGYYCDTQLSVPNSVSGKILVLELQPQMLSNKQIPGLLKVLYLENKLKHEIDFSYVSNKSIELGVT